MRLILICRYQSATRWLVWMYTKISAGNKGNTPWNKGKKRSAEERARISAGVRAKNRERFLKKLEDLGITEEEYAAQKKEARRKREAERRARRTEKGGYTPTEETKKKLSKALKARWASGTVKKRGTDPTKIRRGFTHSEETRKKISESLRRRWAGDPSYREKIVKKDRSKEERNQQISNTLKKKWADPEFRAMMMEKMSNRTHANGSQNPSFREKVSAAMKAKWQDPEYRAKTLTKIRERAEMMRLSRPPKPPRVKKKKKKKKKKLISLLKPGTRLRLGKRRRRVKKSPVLDENGNVVKAQIAKKTSKPVKKNTTVKGSVTRLEALQPGRASSKTSRKEKEPDGSINRLRDERRDLYDLLYGDDDDDDYDDDDDDDDDDSSILDDEDLDSFDPYGLDNS
eukprot:CAMPEP_0116557440 /NCGR_PEP_ID=MMETSP0397-20121206/9242_1 /TAXON_ID=216820 /ORGANISM="Cyclophora tenuis, Strain ECT3854" /LENGTH=399 /DNA_ID=CAMNT_0004082899 /DNA_START=79 /DNA_END=1278 /DNA_ORIENTATION=+